MNLTSYAEMAVRLVNSAQQAGDDRDPLGAISAFRALISDQPRLARAVTALDLDALRAIRAELSAVFAAAAAGRDSVAIAQLNALLARSPVQPELVSHDDQGWHLHLAEHGSAADQYQARAVAGLTLAVSQHGLSRLGTCSIASCHRVFIDASSNRSRRYCPEHGAARGNVTTIRAQARQGRPGRAATAAS
ncbi:MAG: CGNR zinc finger domain-containing protein [Streptosporangiaceae bacterium]